ncbi:MAG: hypothetical protein ABL967_19930, partial [Bryobacteraceae bacterium]
MPTAKTLLFLWIAFAAQAFGQSYDIQTIAGGGFPDNIPALSADFDGARGVAVDANGNVYVALSTYGVVVRIGPDGIVHRVAGNGTHGSTGDGGPATEASICACTALDIAISKTGDLYILDGAARRIRKVSGGIITTVAGGGTRLTFANPPGGPPGPGNEFVLRGPSAMTLTKDDDLIIVDNTSTQADLIKISNGTLTYLSTQFLPGIPMHVAADISGNIYIATTNGVSKITNGLRTALSISATGGLAFDSQGVLYTASGFTVSKAGSGTFAGNGTAGLSGDGGPATAAQLAGPVRMAFDSADNMYLIDGGRIRVIRNGIINTIAGAGAAAFNGDGGPALGAQFTLGPIAVSSDGAVYLADTNHHRVRRVRNGVITTVAGTGSAGFSGDNGPGAAAQINAPSGIAVDRAGNVFISDYGNRRVRKLTNGIISTIAGTGVAGSDGDGGPAVNATLTSPQALTIDSAGDLYILDAGIRKISNGVISSVPSCCSSVKSIAVDLTGRTLVTDWLGGRLLAVDANSVTTLAGLTAPVGLAVSESGQIFVSNASQIYRLDGDKLTVIAGGGAAFRETSPARATILNSSWLAAGAAGNLYAMESNRIRLLTPSSNTCSYSVDQASVAVPLTGGTVRFQIQTAPDCTWYVSGLPTWITAVEPSMGTGSATLNLNIAASTISTRSATVLLADSLSATIAQTGTCSVSLSSRGAIFPASGGGKSVTVTGTPASCGWTVNNAPPWMTVNLGPTGVGFIANPNTGPARSVTMTIGGVSYVVEQASGLTSNMSFLGSLAQVASQGTWKFSLDLVNLGTSAVQSRVNFLDNGGSELSLPLLFPQAPLEAPLDGSTLERTLAVGAQILVDSPGPDAAAQLIGHGRISANGNVSGFGIFTNAPLGWNAVVPLETRNAAKYVLAFDNTGSLATGVAVSNVAAAQANVAVVIRDDTGAQIGTATINLSGSGHTSFMLNAQYAVTVGKRGTIEFTTPQGGQIS